MTQNLSLEKASLTKRLRGRFAEAVARRHRSQAVARGRIALLRLDDHLLRDIGLDPRQIGDRLRSEPL